MISCRYCTYSPSAPNEEVWYVLEVKGNNYCCADCFDNAYAELQSDVDCDLMTDTARHKLVLSWITAFVPDYDDCGQCSCGNGVLLDHCRSCNDAPADSTASLGLDGMFCVERFIGGAPVHRVFW